MFVEQKKVAPKHDGNSRIRRRDVAPADPNDDAKFARSSWSVMTDASQVVQCRAVEVMRRCIDGSLNNRRDGTKRREFPGESSRAGEMLGSYRIIGVHRSVLTSELVIWSVCGFPSTALVGFRAAENHRC